MYDGSLGIAGHRQPLTTRRIALSVLLCLAPAAVLFLHGRNQPKAQESNPTPAVAVATVRQEDVPVTLQALGTVTPFATVTVRSQISGYLTSVAANEGRIIHKGEFLAQIDARPYHASAEQIQGQLVRDQALLENARLDLTRFQRLIAQDSASHQQADTARATVAQYEGAVRSDRAQLRMQQLNVEYCRITAPIAGRVGLRQLDAGNFVQPSDNKGLMVITQLQPISVIFVLPQNQLRTLLRRTDAAAPLHVTALDSDSGERLADGTLESIDNLVDTATGTVKLRASYANTDQHLFPNQFVNVRLVVDSIKGAQTIPTAAIRHDASGDIVFVISDAGTAHKRTIASGFQYEDRTVVTAGLAPGERVVTDGSTQLVDGTAVSVAHLDATRP